MTTTQQTTTSVDDILQFATEPDTSSAERTTLHEENRRILAGRLKKIVDKVTENDTMLNDANTDGLKALNARLTSRRAAKRPGLNRFVRAGLVVGFLLGALAANIWSELAAPHIKGSSLDLTAGIALLLIGTVLGGFFGSLISDRRSSRTE